jgi:hypothetical protein
MSTRCKSYSPNTKQTLANRWQKQNLRTCTGACDVRTGTALRLKEPRPAARRQRSPCQREQLVTHLCGCAHGSRGLGCGEPRVRAGRGNPRQIGAHTAGVCRVPPPPETRRGQCGAGRHFFLQQQHTMHTMMRMMITIGAMMTTYCTSRETRFRGIPATFHASRARWRGAPEALAACAPAEGWRVPASLRRAQDRQRQHHQTHQSPPRYLSRVT